MLDTILAVLCMSVEEEEAGHQICLGIPLNIWIDPLPSPPFEERPCCLAVHVPCLKACKTRIHGTWIGLFGTGGNGKQGVGGMAGGGCHDGHVSCPSCGWA